MDQTKAYLIGLLGCMTCGAAVAIGAMSNGTDMVSAVLLGTAFAALPIILCIAGVVVVVVIILLVMLFIALFGR